MNSKTPVSFQRSPSLAPKGRDRKPDGQKPPYPKAIPMPADGPLRTTAKSQAAIANAAAKYARTLKRLADR